MKKQRDNAAISKAWQEIGRACDGQAEQVRALLAKAVPPATEKEARKKTRKGKAKK